MSADLMLFRKRLREAIIDSAIDDHMQLPVDVLVDNIITYVCCVWDMIEAAVEYKENEQ